MECSEIKENLYDYKMNRLDRKTFIKVEEHLKACNRCKSELKRLTKTLAIVDLWKPPELSEDFKDRVMSRIEAEEKLFSKRIMDILFRLFYIKVPLGALAVVVLVFLVASIYRSTFMLGIKRIFTGEKVTEWTEWKELKLPSEELDAQNPIVISTKDIDGTFKTLLDLINAYNGKLVRRRPINSGMKVTLRVELSKEKRLLQKLTQLGEVRMERRGYKDRSGNIVVILKKLGS